MSGLPGVSTFPGTYGNVLDNYEEVVDASTDQDEPCMNVLKKDVAALTQVMSRAWVTFLGHATTPTIASDDHGEAWPADDNNQPPEATHDSTGTYKIAWPTTVKDALGVDHTVNFKRVHSVNYESATDYRVSASRTAANEITVYVRNSAGALNDAVGVPITVTVR